MLFLAVLAVLFLADVLALADGQEAWNWVGGALVVAGVWVSLLVLASSGR